MLSCINEPGGPEIIICCGSGGVGKTTLSAAIGLYGAISGKKTIVLTIDPAKRLADALGLSEFNSGAQRVPVEKVSSASSGSDGQLFAMMLDAKRTFDNLIQRYAPPELRQKILNNRYYQHLSNNMAGSHEYMAMEKLYEIYHQGDYDLIVLDTPPSRRALDFLEAPQKLLNLLGHHFFINMFKPSFRVGRWGMRFFNILASSVLKVIGKIIGRQVLADFKAFMQLWDDVLFEGFSRRAAAVRDLLGSRRTLFLAISTPQSLPLKEAVFLSEKLRQNNMPFGGFVINRVHMVDNTMADDVVKADLQKLFVEESVAADTMNKLIAAHKNFQKMASNDALAVKSLIENAGSSVEIMQIPVSEKEVADLEDLLILCRHFEDWNKNDS